MTKPIQTQASEAMLAEVKRAHPQLDKVTHYLEQGADISFQDEEGNTPIIIAVGNHNYKLVELLLAHGADINIRNNLRQTVFNVVKDDDIWHLLRRERDLPTPDPIKSANQIEGERIEAIKQRTRKEREVKPFNVSQLKLEEWVGKFKPQPSQAQIDKLEKHYGHPIPAMLKEIYLNYNGGEPGVEFYTEERDEFHVNYFFKVDENYDQYWNIWYAIEAYSGYLGPDTLPLAEGGGDSIVYLKWVEGQSQVWWFLYGGDMVTDDDEDESDIDDPDAMPFLRLWISNSLEEFLENSYEDR